jgi:hypothetical protein
MRSQRACRLGFTAGGSGGPLALMCRSVLVGLFAILASGVGVGCGGGPQPAQSPAPDSKPARDSARPGPGTEGQRQYDGRTVSAQTRGQRAGAARRLPAECVHEGEFCVPPRSFVRRLCQGNYPDLAVYLMRKDQPWSRRYVRVEEAHAINAVTGRQGESKLLFGEEVLVLRYRTGMTLGAMQVSGMEGYEVLRWDGTCATLAEGELIAWVPPKQTRHSVLSWRHLGNDYRRALLRDEQIAAAERTHRDECRGAKLGRSASCLKAVESLNGAVEAAVHAGIALPVPREIP